MKILKHLSLPLLATFCVSASPLSIIFAAETVSKEMELVTFRTSFRTVGGLLETKMRDQSPPFTEYSPIFDKALLTSLSEDLLAEIGKFLSPVDFTDFCLVCKKPGQSGKISRKALSLRLTTSEIWLDHLPELRKIPELTIWHDESRAIGDEDIKLYTLSLPGITRVYLGREPSPTKVRITDGVLKHIGTLAQLQELSLKSIQEEVTDEGLKHIGTLDKLKKLELSFLRRVTGVGFQHFRSLLALQRLQLLSMNLKDTDIQHLSSLSALRQLELLHMDEITDAALQHLSGLLALERLRLESLNKVTDRGIQHLSGLPNLRQLELRFIRKVTDEGIQYLSGLPNLRQLELGYMDEITDAALQHLSGLLTLKRLGLEYLTKMTDGGIQHLSGLPALRHLKLIGMIEVTDEGMLHLNGLSLESLELNKLERVTDRGIQRLSLSALKNLTLCDLERIESMPLLMDMPALLKLRLEFAFSSFELTNADLRRLACLPQLKHLTLRTRANSHDLHRVVA
jgi:hypothetical protein